MFIHEPLFPAPTQQGVMYLMLPMRDQRFTKTEMKIGWATDMRRQRERNRRHRRQSPGMETVAVWPASRDYEENFHTRNAAESIPGRNEWYFPTVAIIQAVVHEVRAQDENAQVTWLAGYNQWRLMERLQQLLVTANEIELLMLNYRQTGAL